MFFLSKCPDLLGIKDYRGQNPLHHAIMQQSNLLVDEFLNHKELLLGNTDNGSTTWHIVCRYGDVDSINKIKNLLNDNPQIFDLTDEHGKQGEDYLIERNLNNPSTSTLTYS